MMILACPDKLVNLAVEALCVYVSDFMVRIITEPASPREHGGTYQHYQETCRRLEQYINEFVPEDIAMEVTIKLMRRVNMTYTKLMHNRDFKRACAEMAPLVLKSVVHSSLTSLECLPDVSHPSLLDYYIVPNCDLIYKALPLFRGLQAVKLGRANRTDDVPLDVQGFKDTLEEFSSRSFVEADLETLANNCSHIKCLDIDGYFNVNNENYRHVLSFPHLLELNLCEIRFMSERDLIFITNSLGGLISISLDSGGKISSYPNRSKVIRALGCNFSMIHRSVPRIEKFTNLTSLALTNVLTKPSSQLGKLRHLQKFALNNSRFSLIEDMLLQIGNQLICLDLINVAGTDFRFIGVNCRSLECLHLCFSVGQYLTLPIQRDVDKSRDLPQRDFANVVRLKLYVEDRRDVEYILTRIRNLKTLLMGYTFNDDESFLESIMQRTGLTDLEELHWGSSIVVKFSGGVTTINEFYPDGRVSVHHTRI
jgi:hypothetical protein